MSSASHDGAGGLVSQDPGRSDRKNMTTADDNAVGSLREPMVGGEGAVPAAAPSARGASGPHSVGRTLGIDNRFLAPILITCILGIAQNQYVILESYWHTGLAIIAALLLELVLGRFATGRWPHLASAYISGISVGILIRSPYLWPYILCSLLSIASKYALRVRGRHLWNPSNLGVSLMLFLAPTAVASLSQQWGNDIRVLAVIWVLGCLILFRLGRLHITLTYVLAFVAFSFVRSWINNEVWLNEVAPITGPMYQLFIFFMITDPKTTTRTWRRQVLVTILVAAVETGLRLMGGMAGIHAPYYSLFIVFPVANLVEIWWESRQVGTRLNPGHERERSCRNS